MNSISENWFMVLHLWEQRWYIKNMGKPHSGVAMRFVKTSISHFILWIISISYVKTRTWVCNIWVFAKFASSRFNKKKLRVHITDQPLILVFAEMSISWSRLIIQVIKSFSLSSLSSKAEEEQGLRLRLFLRDGLCRSVDRLLMNQQGNFVHSSSQTNPCKNPCLLIWFPFHTFRRSIEEKNIFCNVCMSFNSLKHFQQKFSPHFLFIEMPVEILQRKRWTFLL